MTGMVDILTILTIVTKVSFLIHIPHSLALTTKLRTINTENEAHGF
jgi:hypothetical protein